MRDDKRFMGVERVSWGWNSSALFLKYGCIGKLGHETLTETDLIIKQITEVLRNLRDGFIKPN
jgi:hypothetical protein